MTVVVPPRAHQLAAFMCRLADELTAMGGTAELVAFHYVQSQATVRVTISAGVDLPALSATGA